MSSYAVGLSLRTMTGFSPQNVVDRIIYLLAIVVKVRNNFEPIYLE